MPYEAEAGRSAARRPDVIVAFCRAFGRVHTRSSRDAESFQTFSKRGVSRRSGGLVYRSFFVESCEAYFVPSNAREIPKLTFAFSSWKCSEIGSDVEVNLSVSVVFKSR